MGSVSFGKAPMKFRTQIWSAGVAGARHTLKSGDDDNLMGLSTELQLGYGFIWEKSFLISNVALISGPWAAKHHNLSLDFSGTGLTFMAGYNAEKGSLRAQDNGYGFALGFNYSDIIGRKIGDIPTSKGDLMINTHLMRVTGYSLMPSIFFCWLQPGRPVGNQPELLKTTIEGYILTLGIAVPFKSSYKITSEQSDTTKNQDDKATTDPFQVTKKGKMQGYSIFIAFSTLIGI